MLKPFEVSAGISSIFVCFLDADSGEVWTPGRDSVSPECHHPHPSLCHPSPGLSPDNCQTTISTFSPQIKLEMSSAPGYNHHQPSMSWKVAIFQHIISHSIYWMEAANSSSQLSG